MPSFAPRAVADTPPDLPDRLFGRLGVQPHLQKYSYFRLTQLTSISLAVPARERGVGHRHERWGGMRWTQRRRARGGVRRAGLGP